MRPLLVEQKQNVKGIGCGTEGVFAPWWDDLYNKTAVGTKIEKSFNKKSKKIKVKRKRSSNNSKISDEPLKKLKKSKK